MKMWELSIYESNHLKRSNDTTSSSSRYGTNSFDHISNYRSISCKREFQFCSIMSCHNGLIFSFLWCNMICDFFCKSESRFCDARLCLDIHHSHREWAIDDPECFLFSEIIDMIPESENHTTDSNNDKSTSNKSFSMRENKVFRKCSHTVWV